MMKCPVCEETFETDVAICPVCNTPLSNAQYKQIEKEKKKKGFVWIILLFLLLLLGAGGFFGFRYYLDIVESTCSKKTAMLFDIMKEMDLSDLPKDQLPEVLKDNPNIREVIADCIDRYIASESLGGMLDKAGLEIDGEQICDEIAEQACFEIIDSTADYHSCTVTVRTSNKDFGSVLASFGDKAKNELVKDASFWGAITDSLKDIFIHREDENDASDSSLSDILKQYYEDSKEDAETMTHEGTITYEFTNGKWHLKGFDPDLIFSFYGISTDMINME